MALLIQYLFILYNKKMEVLFAITPFQMKLTSRGISHKWFLYTSVKTISLKVNENCDWREDELGRVRHIQEKKGTKQVSNEDESERTVYCPGRVVRVQGLDLL
jgi:hypothetical protein